MNIKEHSLMCSADAYAGRPFLPSFELVVVVFLLLCFLRAFFSSIMSNARSQVKSFTFL